MRDALTLSQLIHPKSDLHADLFPAPPRGCPPLFAFRGLFRDGFRHAHGTGRESSAYGHGRLRRSAGLSLDRLRRLPPAGRSSFGRRNRARARAGTDERTEKRREPQRRLGGAGRRKSGRGGGGLRSRRFRARLACARGRAQFSRRGTLDEDRRKRHRRDAAHRHPGRAHGDGLRLRHDEERPGSACAKLEFGKGPLSRFTKPAETPVDYSSHETRCRELGGKLPSVADLQAVSLKGRYNALSNAFGAGIAAGWPYDIHYWGEPSSAMPGRVRQLQIRNGSPHEAGAIPKSSLRHSVCLKPEE